MWVKSNLYDQFSLGIEPTTLMLVMWTIRHFPIMSVYSFLFIPLDVTSILYKTKLSVTIKSNSKMYNLYKQNIGTGDIIEITKNFESINKRKGVNQWIDKVISVYVYRTCYTIPIVDLIVT